MKKYQINPKEKEFRWGKMLVIELGEDGRGRELTLIPYHAPEDAEFLEIGETRSGSPKIVPSKSSEGWIALLSGAGCYTRGTYGTVFCLEKDKEKIKIIAHGSGAFGSAGRVGWWHEY